MKTISKFDLCVIGAGSGGLSVAAGAAQMGARVVLVEKGKMGGDCLNYGCIPSKALLSAAHKANNMQEGKEFGKPILVEQAAEKVKAILQNDTQGRFDATLDAKLRAAHNILLTI